MRDIRCAVRAVGILAAPPVLAACTTGAAYTVYSENDVYAIGNRDRYYTNGLRVSGLHRADSLPDTIRSVAEALPPVSSERTTQVGWLFGQDMYTPTDIKDPTPPLDERPYGGWSYAGVLVAKAVKEPDGPQGDRVDVLEVDLGVVGPPSFAEEAQSTFHRWIGSPRPRGWDTQLPFEPGLVVAYEHRHRCLSGDLGSFGATDVIGTLGVTGGNVFTHGTVGVLARWGNELRRDFGPNTIHTTAVDVPDGEHGPGPRWYLFAGAEGRVVARNLFLDGSTFRDSRSVEREWFVSEARIGFAFEWDWFRVSLSEIRRSREFEGQPEPHHYGSLALTVDLKF